jgi:hypothetical protein
MHPLPNFSSQVWNSRSSNERLAALATARAAATTTKNLILRRKTAEIYWELGDISYRRLGTRCFSLSHHCIQSFFSVSLSLSFSLNVYLAINFFIPSQPQEVCVCVCVYVCVCRMSWSHWLVMDACHTVLCLTSGSVSLPRDCWANVG